MTKARQPARGTDHIGVTPTMIRPSSRHERITSTRPLFFVADNGMIITILDQTRAIKLGCDGEEATCRSFDAKQPNEAKTEKLVEASDSDVAPQARKVVTTTIKKEAGQPTTNELNCVPNDLKLDPQMHAITATRAFDPPCHRTLKFRFQALRLEGAIRNLRTVPTAPRNKGAKLLSARRRGE